MESESSDENFVPRDSPKSKQPKQSRRRHPVTLAMDPNNWSDKTALAADKHKISNRALTEVVSTLVQSGGGSISGLALSKDTIRRQRIKLRSKRADEIRTDEMKKLRANDAEQKINIYCTGTARC